MVSIKAPEDRGGLVDAIVDMQFEATEAQQRRGSMERTERAVAYLD
jgi:hypothetical protein